MREGPIPFTMPLVRKVLAEQKTQTRRVINPQPTDQTTRWEHCITSAIRSEVGKYIPVDQSGSVAGTPVRCPYGAPGDRLWVRERMRVIRVRELNNPDVTMKVRVCYEADGKSSGWLPYPDRLEGTPVPGKCLAYGGYKEASRLLLRITDVRVERLQAITEEDARAEGVEPKMTMEAWACFSKTTGRGFHVFREPSPDMVREENLEVVHQPPRPRSPFSVEFRDLWDRINGKRPGRSWDNNPWVWVVGFKLEGVAT